MPPVCYKINSQNLDQSEIERSLVGKVAVDMHFKLLLIVAFGEL